MANEKMWKTGFTIVNNFEFCCVVVSHWELFRVMNDGIVISDIFSNGSRSLMAVKILRCFDVMLTALSDSVQPNSTVTGVMFRSLSYFTSVTCALS